MKNDYETLVETVKTLRRQHFTDIPEDLVVRLLEIEADYVSNRAEAVKRIERAIEDYLKEAA